MKNNVKFNNLCNHHIALGSHHATLFADFREVFIMETGYLRLELQKVHDHITELHCIYIIFIDLMTYSK